MPASTIVNSINPLMSLLALVFSITFLNSVRAGEPKYVPIASHANTPDVNAKEGVRAQSILRKHKIKSISAGSAGLTMSVPIEDATQARQLLAKAIQEEGLRITLLKMNEEGTRAVIITPSSAVEAAAEEDAVLTKQISEVLKDVGELKAGMTRADLMKIFDTEGGISSPTRRTFVHRRCPFIKVDVQFTLAEKVDLPEERPSDKISEISKPYLAWSVMD